MNDAYQRYVARLKAQHGQRFDDSELAPKFRPFFHGDRIKVRSTYPGGEAFDRTGTVSGTGGWRPALMLMHRSNVTGSWDLLREADEIIAVWDGRKYVPRKGA